MQKKSRPKGASVPSSIAMFLTKGALPDEVEGFTAADAQGAAAFVENTLAGWNGKSPAIALEALPHGGMRLCIVNRDMPFLVDSISAELTAQGIDIKRLLHPVLLSTGKKGVLALTEKPGKQSERISLIYIEADNLAADRLASVQTALSAVLGSVEAAVTSWKGLQAVMRLDAAHCEDEETAALLNWFGGGQLTLLGHALCGRKGALTDKSGLCSSLGEPLLSRAARDRAFDWFDKNPAQPLLIKSNLLSPVHRRVPIALIILPRIAGKRVTALSIHAGLWTSAALATAPGDTPILRKKLAKLERKFGFDPTGHAGKALTHALSSLPHDLLIAMEQKSLEAVAQTAMSVIDRPRPALTLSTSPLQRHVTAFVWLPRDALSTLHRLAISEKLEQACKGPLLSWSIDLDESGIALIRYTIDIRDGGKAPAAAPLNRWLGAYLRGWSASVEAALGSSTSEDLTARALALPQAYRDTDGPIEAAVDVRFLARVSAATPHLVRIFSREKTGLHLKLFAASPVDLSAAVPVLENFGFRVLAEDPTALLDGSGHIHNFTLSLEKSEGAAALLDTAGDVEAAIAGVLGGQLENDRFNALMVTANLKVEDVVLFRALFRYLRQTGMAYGLTTVVDALRNAPAIAQALALLFDALHNPAEKLASARAEQQKSAVEAGLIAITALDDDRILRLYRAVILGCLRTNRYAQQSAEALAFKLDSAAIPGLPDPKPWREIFVYSPRVEGIHLRAGPVARGGLRWSDRRDDFRTEVLGLMKAQRVKNAVIVPTGAKGGFIPKQLPDPAKDREGWAAEGKESYRIFIRTLLSVTDNLVKGKVVHPPHMVIRDGDDPYFVVAADKGTASFSDVANAIAQEAGFWLGDAFASGGSKGYDHKAMGITAKGGWISVKRHFAEMGVDVQSQSVRVVGCGDMSGDVFGNGMLLSKAIKLVAAFDHRHIFIDPEPDPAKSWAERARLFALPRSNWVDYDTKLISKGGGVFPRASKIITLSPEMRAVIGSDLTEMEPSQLITALLKSEVDLIWFGGIGTYVKAKAESNAEVGDRANDAHRINATDLRARVIGEGANLGMTQAGRIEFALNGGRINTDFIDNSAGVDCSDNEVNIKIALNGEMIAGRLSDAVRTRLLARMTEDVAEIVLEDNRLQTLALSIAERDGAGDLPAQLRLVERLEAAGKLDRAVEGIAANDELNRRMAEGKGLTRPELAVIMATAKLLLQDALEGSMLGKDPATRDDLFNAFPLEMRRKYAAAIEGHRLRNEIVSTKLANRIVNRMGLIHPFELAEEEGCPLDDVAEAFVIAEQLFDLPSLWNAIDQGHMPEATRFMLYEQLAIELRAHMADILRNAVDGRSIDKAILAYRPAIEQLTKQRKTLLPGEARRQTSAFAVRLTDAGTPPAIVEQLVKLAELDGAIGLAALSARSGTDIATLTRAFTAIGEAMGIDWAQGVAMQLDPIDPWERLLTASLARDFQTMRLSFLARIGGKKPYEAVTRWLSVNETRVNAFRRMVESAKRSPATPAMLAQIAGQSRMLLAR